MSGQWGGKAVSCHLHRVACNGLDHEKYRRAQTLVWNERMALHLYTAVRS